MNALRRLAAAVILLVIFMLTGCDSDSVPTVGSEVIDSSGGMVSASDGKGHTARLWFPSYAIAGQQTVILSFTSTNDTAFAQALTPRIQIEPAGLLLLEEATLNVTFDDESALKQGAMLYSIGDSAFRPPVDNMEAADGSISGGIYLLGDAAVSVPTMQEVSAQVGLLESLSAKAKPRSIQQFDGAAPCIPVDYGWQETFRDVGGLIGYAEESMFFGDDAAAAAATSKANETLNDRINDFLSMTPSGDQCAQYAIAAERYVSAGMRLGILDESHPLYEKYNDIADQCAIRFNIEIDDDVDGHRLYGIVQCHAPYWEFLKRGVLSGPVGAGTLSETVNKEWTEPPDEKITIQGSGTVSVQADGWFDYSQNEYGQGIIYLELSMHCTRNYSGTACNSKTGCLPQSDTSSYLDEYKGPFTNGYQIGDASVKSLRTLHIINMPTRPGFDDLYCP